MSVRRRRWTTARGVPKEAWVVDYTDQHGTRHIKSFERKKDADAYHSTVRVEVRCGTHTADSGSITVSEAGVLWIATCKQSGLERATIENYQQHLNLHIVPYIGAIKLSQLSAPLMRAFQDDLLAGKPAPGQTASSQRSRALTKKIIGSVGSILSEAQERGLVSRNVVRDLRTNRRRGKDRQLLRRQKGRLKVGIDIPTPDEIRSIVPVLSGRWRPLLLTAIFAGLRASELRGLRWSDIDLKRGELNVRQRADRFRAIGKPKTEAGERTVPFPPIVLNALREWRLAGPRGALDLVFPNGNGNVEFRGNIVQRGFWPAQIAAGVTKEVVDGSEVIVMAKYPGLHALRHFYASWCINRKQDGGLELPPKVVQTRLGHSSIVVTMDTYGHLFPNGDDGSELAEAERSLLG